MKIQQKIEQNDAILFKKCVFTQENTTCVMYIFEVYSKMDENCAKNFDFSKNVKKSEFFLLKVEKSEFFLLEVVMFTGFHFKIYNKTTKFLKNTTKN